MWRLNTIPTCHPAPEGGERPHTLHSSLASARLRASPKPSNASLSAVTENPPRGSSESCYSPNTAPPGEGTAQSRTPPPTQPEPPSSHLHPGQAADTRCRLPAGTPRGGTARHRKSLSMSPHWFQWQITLQAARSKKLNLVLKRD